MMKNKFEVIAELIGVEFEKPFNIVGRHYNPYVIRENGMFDSDGDEQTSVIGEILDGSYDIEKIPGPWTPKDCEDYFYVEFNLDNPSGEVSSAICYNDETDKVIIETGLYFKTESDADTCRLIGLSAMQEFAKSYHKANKK